jgi:hypothetical protein
MGVINDNLSMLYLGVAAAIYFRPEYAIFGSRAGTLILSFAILTAWKILYQLALYPAFFTPIKHIRAPPVHKPNTLLPVQSFANNLRAEPG